MVKNDIVRLFGLIGEAYPTYKNQFNEKNINQKTCEVWLRMLQDIPIDILLLALQKHIVKSKYPPTIAELRDEAISILDNSIDFDEAWEIVIKAIRAFGYMRKKDALANMPKEVAEAVEAFGWQDLCMSENIAVDRGQFRKAYEIRKLRNKNNALMPTLLSNNITFINLINNNATKEIEPNNKKRDLFIELTGAE